VVQDRQQSALLPPVPRRVATVDVPRTNTDGDALRRPYQTDMPSAVDVAIDTPIGRGPTRYYYAVVKGRTTGILLTWKAVLASVSGFPHVKFKSFRQYTTTEEWYLQQLQLLGIIPPERDLSDDDVSVEEMVKYNEVGVPRGSTTPRDAVPVTRPPDVYPTRSRPSSSADLVDFRMAGPDPSTGDPKQINNVSINISSEV
jgi:hypothetical protein